MKLAIVAPLAAAAVMAGCGDSTPAARSTDRGRPPAHTNAPKARLPSDARVIREWADKLRAGDVAAATRLFGLPVTVENGGPTRQLRTSAEVRAFNASLPCGARLLRTRHRGRYTIATFRLTERRGGDCGVGVGDTAATAFRLRAGKIVEWLRVPAPQEPSGLPPGTGTS